MITVLGSQEINAKCCFRERGENWNTQSNTFQKRQRERERTNSYYCALKSGFNAWPQWWKVRALTTPPMLVCPIVFG